MDPQGGRQMNQHHQRAMDLLNQSVPANNANANVNANANRYGVGDEESGGLRSAWSPDRGDGEGYIPWGAPPSASTVKTSFPAVMHHRPGLWPKAGGRRRRRVGFAKSLKAVVLSNCLNVLLPAIPVLWTLHFLGKIDHVITFGLCIISLIPLIKLLDFSAENLASYCGKDLGDLIVTMNNAVEAILALSLLVNWELRLLQSTIIGVVMLRLLLVPGTAFITGGARIATQELHPHLTQLNHSLLTMGVLTLLLPVSFFAALDRGVYTQGASSTEADQVVSDSMRDNLLKVSRGIAIILLIVYICSRFFLHRPPGEENALHKRKDAPEELKRMAHELEEKEPEANFTVSLVLLLICGGLMAVTAEMLVHSIDPMRKKFDLPEEWFGLILLPVVSFSPDALISVVNFIRSTLFRQHVTTPPTLAEYRSIELAIQFMLLWTPFVVLLGWIIQRPMSLLFDLFEVAVLLGSCFLLNYVTADAKTNWAEGVMLVALYFMIALTAWFYPGQPEINIMLSRTSVYQALQNSNLTIVNDSLATAPTSTSASDPAYSVVSFPSPPTPVVSPPSNENLTDKLQALLTLYDILLAENMLEENHTRPAPAKPSQTEKRPKHL